jgi:hypothetical protein
MSVVAPRIMDFGRIVLNLIFYFLTVCKAISAGVDMSFWKRYGLEESDSIKMNGLSNGFLTVESLRILPSIQG